MPNNQKGLAPILIIFLIALVVGGYLIYKNSIASQTNVFPPSSKQTAEIAASGFQWNKETKQASFKEANVLLKFELTERPEKVLRFKASNALVIVTSVSDSAKSFNNIYIFRTDELKKVAQGEYYNLNEETKGLPTRFDIVGFSPDGHYLLFDKLWWEVSEKHAANVEKGTEISLNEKSPNPFGFVFWSPDSSCIFNIHGLGMWGPSFELGKESSAGFNFIGFERPSNLIDFQLGNTKVYWGNDCSGIISLHDDKNNNAFYQFNKTGNILTKTEKPNFQELKEVEVDQERLRFE